MPNWTTGPSTGQTPYLVELEPNVRFTSIISTGDQVGYKPDGVSPWVFGGIPDGIGAFDNGDGTITVLVNHEVSAPGAAVVREHGAAGAYVSQLIVDKATLEVVDAFDAANKSYVDPEGDGTWTLSPTTFSRLCSADLPDVSAFYDAATGLGTQERIFMNGEESGNEGRAFAWVVTGAEARTVWELPALGNFAWENSVASPNSGAKTVVVGTDDSTPGQVYVYVGDKQATGNTVEMAGLTNGKLYGIKADGIGNTATGDAENQIEGDGDAATIVPTGGSFSMVEIAGASTLNGADIETASDAAGVSEWWRPEDGAWDTIDPNRFYFATTAAIGQPSRLWALDFVDVTNPLLGGTFTMLVEGNEGHVMFDNLTVDATGKVWLVEDPGSFAASAKMWVYDPATDSLNDVAEHDPARFGDTLPGGGTILPTAPFNNNEEASGIVDVTDLLGDADTQAFLVDTQAHYPFPGGLSDEVVEGGQLMVMYVDTPTDGDGHDNAVNGSYLGEALSGRGGNDLMRGGSGDDTLRGGRGDDSIEGGNGNDVLRGAAGGDTLYGGAGHDSLNGSEGGDVIVYRAAAEGGDHVGWGAGDVIQVSAAGFGSGLVEGQALVFGTTFFWANVDGATPGGFGTAGTGVFIQDLDTRNLWWDADGAGGADAVLIGDFAGISLAAENFQVIA